MVGFIRSLFESALKTNDALEFGVVTGCLRVSKERIFTGLNHLEISSIRNNGLEEAFRQIKDRKYEEGVLEDGYIGAKSYGVCFCRKACVIEESP